MQENKNKSSETLNERVARLETSQQYTVTTLSKIDGKMDSLTNEVRKHNSLMSKLERNSERIRMINESLEELDESVEGHSDIFMVEKGEDKGKSVIKDNILYTITVLSMLTAIVSVLINIT